jgi:hypothetical protein
MPERAILINFLIPDWTQSAPSVFLLSISLS